MGEITVFRWFYAQNRAPTYVCNYVVLKYSCSQHVLLTPSEMPKKLTKVSKTSKIAIFSCFMLSMCGILFWRLFCIKMHFLQQLLSFCSGYGQLTALQLPKKKS